MLSKISILGVSVTTSSKEEILSYIFHHLTVLQSSCLSIVTPNPEQIILAQKNTEFRRILNNADVALPDGAGLVWAMRKRSKIKDPCLAGRQERSKIERISGVDFMENLCMIAAEKKLRVLFYGGRGGVGGKALAALHKRYPGLQGIAEEGALFQMLNVKCPALPAGKQMTNQYQMTKNQKNGENSFSSAAIRLAQVIRNSNIHIVFIGLGAPKQEFFMDTLIHTLQGVTLQGGYSNVVVMVVGGAFDILAGKVKRASKGVQQMGFEWLWRLFQEPWRWKRQAALLQFIALVLKNKNMNR